MICILRLRCGSSVKVHRKSLSSFAKCSSISTEPLLTGMDAVESSESDSCPDAELAFERFLSSFSLKSSEEAAVVAAMMLLLIEKR